MKRLFQIAVLAALTQAGPLRAHDGPHGPLILADVQRAVRDGQVVAITLTVTGLDADHTVTIADFAALGARAAPLPAPVPVTFATDATVRVLLTFVNTPPDIFTMGIDFGPDGQGAVVVIPTPAHAPD
ncbi:MAG: hypothetical protein AAGL96_05730 [Pseudomonadota bacterium]